MKGVLLNIGIGFIVLLIPAVIISLFVYLGMTVYLLGALIIATAWLVGDTVRDFMEG